MALRFLPDRLPSRKKTISSSTAPPAAMLRAVDFLSSTTFCTSPCSERNFASRSAGVIFVWSSGHRSGSYFGSLVSVVFLIRISVSTSSATATIRVIR